MKRISCRNGLKERKRSAVFFLLPLFAAVLFIMIDIRAEAKTNLTVQKYYTSVELSSGDTLQSIAEKYVSSEYKSTSAYALELKRINHLTDDSVLQAGDHLVIPYYAAVTF